MSRSKHWCMGAVLFAALVTLSGCQAKAPAADEVSAAGGLSIALDQLSETPQFFDCESDGVAMQVIALKDGDGIAIMNDVVNEARALRMLEATGLIKLKDDITDLATVADIAENPKHLVFNEMEAALTASAMSDPSIAIAFLNGTHAKDAGLTNDQALYMEQYDPNNPDMHGIINVIAARADRADDPTFARIAEVYHSDEVRALFDTVYKGVYIPAWE